LIDASEVAKRLIEAERERTYIAPFSSEQADFSWANHSVAAEFDRLGTVEVFA